MINGIKGEKKNIIKKPELLAPAGDLEKLKWAIMYGADAVYIGGPAFGLRANATNFTMGNIKEAVSFAHNRERKIYVTVNITLHQHELEMLISYLKELDEIGVDAIIISDPSVMVIAKKYTKLLVHLSTQQSTLNYEAISFWKKQGISRVIMGREVTRDELNEIKDKVDIEIECFIHGAMCASYSGRCVLSNFLTARDSNRGGCSQICRWNFDLLNNNKEKIIGEKDFTFCTKDLSLINYIPEMIDLGISSFKIEGRMRSIYYVATVVNIYRKVIDEYCDNPNKYTYNSEYKKILDNCANRESISQFYDNNYGTSCQYYIGREEVSNQDFLGIVLNYDLKTKLATIEQRNYFKKGDIVEIFGPNIETITFKINDIVDEEGNYLDVVRHPRQIVKIKLDRIIYSNNLMRIKKS